MPEYLSKEEVRQWRSSLEKITLEEFAKRLGKVINEEKTTNDIVDHVMQTYDFSIAPKEEYQTKVEKIHIVAAQAITKERELMNNVVKRSPDAKIKITPAAKTKDIKEVKKEVKKKLETEKIEKVEKIISSKVKAKADTKKNDNAEKTTKAKSAAKASAPKTKSKKAAKTEKAVSKMSLKEEANIVLKKSLTAREQVIFDYLLDNKNKVVYAKDMATLLDLPRDYIYKYIKGIRGKLETDILNNADKGGFVLSI